MDHSPASIARFSDRLEILLDVSLIVTEMPHVWQQTSKLDATPISRSDVHDFVFGFRRTSVKLSKFLKISSSRGKSRKSPCSGIQKKASFLRCSAADAAACFEIPVVDEWAVCHFEGNKVSSLLGDAISFRHHPEWSKKNIDARQASDAPEYIY